MGTIDKLKDLTDELNIVIAESFLLSDRMTFNSSTKSFLEDPNSIIENELNLYFEKVTPTGGSVKNWLMLLSKEKVLELLDQQLADDEVAYLALEDKASKITEKING